MSLERLTNELLDAGLPISGISRLENVNDLNGNNCVMTSSEGDVILHWDQEPTVTQIKKAHEVCWSDAERGRKERCIQAEQANMQKLSVTFNNLSANEQYGLIGRAVVLLARLKPEFFPELHL